MYVCMYMYMNNYTSDITPKLATMQLCIFMSIVNMGTLLITQNTFSVLSKSIFHVTALIKKLRQITNCDGRNCWLVAICDGSKYNFSDWCHLCQRVYSQVQKTCLHQHRTLSDRFFCTSIMDFITDIHTHRYTSEITPKWAKMQLFILMSKVNMGTLPATQSTCYWRQYATSRPLSQIATNHKLRRQGFSDWCE